MANIFKFCMPNHTGARPADLSVSAESKTAPTNLDEDTAASLLELSLHLADAVTSDKPRIVGTLASFDDSVDVGAFWRHFSTFAEKHPKWTSEIHAQVVNHQVKSLWHAPGQPMILSLEAVRELQHHQAMGKGARWLMQSIEAGSQTAQVDAGRVVSIEDYDIDDQDSQDGSEETLSMPMPIDTIPSGSGTTHYSESRRASREHPDIDDIHLVVSQVSVQEDPDSSVGQDLSLLSAVLTKYDGGMRVTSPLHDGIFDPWVVTLDSSTLYRDRIAERFSTLARTAELGERARGAAELVAARLTGR